MTYALSAPLQRAVYEVLTGDPGLQALVDGHIYDGPLPLETYDSPVDYVTLGSR